MEYGKSFGVGVGGGMALFGIRVGYGWVVFGSLLITIAVIIAVRRFFRRGKHLGW